MIISNKNSAGRLNKDENQEYMDIILPPNRSNDEIWITSFDLEAAIQFKKDVFRKFEEDPKKPIVININSYGGSATGLFMMLDTMGSILAIADTQHFCFVTACMGAAMSAGAVLLSAGGIRFATPLSSIMLHQVSSDIYGPMPDASVEYEEMKRINETVLTFLNEKCKIKGGVEELKGLLARNKYLSPWEAKELGIIDHVGYPKLIAHTIYEIGIMGLVQDEPRELPKSNKVSGKKAKSRKGL
jgi:ATP-dependent Clp endopeptidase proteolytic subunit ClpP